jgi:predicted PurR-regulated permease PerM
MTIQKEELKKYLPLAIIAVLVVISFLIIKDYIIPIITAFILSYLILPVHKKLSKKIPEKLSAIISILIILLIILVPLTGMISGVISHSYELLSSDTFNNFLNKISESPLIDKWGIDVQEITNKSIQLIISLLTDLATSIASALLALLIMTISMFYFLTDWDKLSKSAIKYFPFKNKNKVAKDISKITKNLIYGTFLIALIEFVIASIGFGIAGIGPFFLLAIITGLFAFIPALGPTIVWVPTFIVLLIQNNIFASTIVLITGLIMSLYVDTILRAKITGKKTGIHPIIILVGIIGGVTVLGIAGFIIGPLILSYTIKLLEDLAED